MANPRVPASSRRLTIAAVVYSGVIILGGAALSVVIGDGIALLCATGLAVLPVAGVLRRPARSASR
jgi:hypothetical protein